MILRVENLTKEYQRSPVVDRLSLEVKQGEVVGLLGPNGAGKTTTFHMMAGLVKPTQGKIFLGDEEITHLPTYRRARKGIAYLPQNPSVFQGLVVKENLLAILETLDLSVGEQEEKAKLLLSELGVTHLKDQKAYLLSGGERRRVEIARALATSPSFMLLDEPFAGIDPITVSDLQTIIFDLKNKGIGILVTDHNVRETLEITDFSYIMHQGKILIAGKRDELTQNEEARRIFLGENFKL
ncbi:LPS export ABC transporter ATP-binding protein [Candidatus Aerophobetes bacterium]|uniref:LPS export ABC transporter ATP-binding protein n=1 Tax=Aerophobetes bacterium TaxID=2030807 RepID=A0A523W751_UNCAE|nr:MAG: LPS export ABC transporter ATP-binding protein [Candidatus Aerophobetes bacterium]